MVLAKRIEQPHKKTKLHAFQIAQFCLKLPDFSPLLFSAVWVNYDELLVYHIKVINFDITPHKLMMSFASKEKRQ